MYFLYYCVLLAVSVTTYAWFYFDKEYRDNTVNWGVLRVSFFIQSFIVLTLLIYSNNYLMKRVSRSYLKTFRWVTKNTSRKRG